MTTSLRTPVFGLIAIAALAGCNSGLPSGPPAERPVVPVSYPVEREVIDYVDYTGRTDAVQSVNIIPRVTGYLVKMPFKEGSEVKAGDLLFEVDPRPYRAQLDQSSAQIALAEAQYQFAKANFERDLILADKNAISQKDFEQDKAAFEEAKARVNAYKASTDVYALNLEFTTIKSPIDGKVSRYYLTLGNLVNQDQTLLTTVMSLDPMYVYFDMDERTVLRVRDAINQGRITKVRNIGDIPVFISLAHEEDFRHKGKLNFFNNQVNAATGTITVRAEFDNPEPVLTGQPNRTRLALAASIAALGAWPQTEWAPCLAFDQLSVPRGVRLLSPGMFVRVRMPIGNAHRAILVIDRALGSDQGLKYVYVLDKENKVQYRRVQTGALQEDGLRVIESGLTAKDRVVVGALQQIRPGMQIEPEMIAMPSLNQPAMAEGDKEKH